MNRYSVTASPICATLLTPSAGAHASPEVPRIPLRVGLTIVTAIHGSNGDYESIKTIVSQDAKAWRIKYSSESSMDNDMLPEETTIFSIAPTHWILRK